MMDLRSAPFCLCKASIPSDGISPTCCSRHVDAARTDPDALAASLGFTPARIKTLETRCEIDVHFVDDATPEIGLNDYVYT